jgi:replication-associated recombination protein RarA
LIGLAQRIARGCGRADVAVRGCPWQFVASGRLVRMTEADAKAFMTSLPTLVVISGPPASGKTTLAHKIAEAVGCPGLRSTPRTATSPGLEHVVAFINDPR